MDIHQDRNGTITKEMVVLGMKNTMLKLGMALRGVQTCGDYIYSGHAFTSSVLLMFINECNEQLRLLILGRYYARRCSR
jgi:hypothetical protein